MCVTYGELTSSEDGEPVMSRNTLKSLIRRGKVHCIKRGGGEGSHALIVYNSLPDKYRKRYEKKNGGTPEELFKKAEMKDKMTVSKEARGFYERFEYSLNGVQTHLSVRLIEEYTINASVLNLLICDLKDKVRMRKQTNNLNGNVWEIITGSLENLRETYNHTLPNNLARIQDKIRKYNRPMVYNEIKYPYNYISIISGKIGNRNTLKITEEAGRLLIALKRSRVPVYNDAQIFERFNSVEVPGHNAGVSDSRDAWKPLKSLRSMKQWFSLPDIEPLWYDAVHGELKAHQRYGRKHQTALPESRDALWYGDGTKLNLYYIGEDGKVRTTMVYEVMDAYSEVLLGYFISETEDYEAQYHAYRMAVRTAGHRPYEIVHDNQGGHKKADSAGLFSKICHVHRTTAPYNPESKTIEGVFGRFQSNVLHRDWRFTGQNITARKASSRPNLEFIEANKASLYTFAELKDRYMEARREWNEARHPVTGVSRMEMYRSSVNGETPEVTPRDMADMFWVMTKKPSMFTSGGIEIEVKGKKYRYEVYAEPGVPDHEWRRKHTRQQFYVMYDPYDMQSVRLYREDRAGEKRFERVAEPYMVIHRAIQEQTEGEAAFIRQEQAANIADRVERQTEAKEIEYSHGVAPEQHGLNTPDLKGVTAEVRRQIDRRTGKYSRGAEEYQIGREGKVISLTTFDELEDSEVQFDVMRAVEKL
jgi:hypothetical protein